MRLSDLVAGESGRATRAASRTPEEPAGPAAYGRHRGVGIAPAPGAPQASCSGDPSGRRRERAAQGGNDAADAPQAPSSGLPCIRRRRRADGEGPGRNVPLSTGHVHEAPPAPPAPRIAADGDDAPIAPHTPDATEEGPAYESLFEDAPGKRRARRERPPATALQRALGLLTRREHSRKELTRKLVSRGVDAGEVEAAVEKLAGAGWQDERRFAESLVRSRASTGYGPLHIRAELGTHGLPSELREDVLASFEGDWDALAADVVRRRFGRVADPLLRSRKAADFLMRRGFPGDIARRASRFDPDDA